MAAPDDLPDQQRPFPDSRHKSLIELAVIVAGFIALPQLEGILNLLQATPTAPAAPASPVALLGYAWNLVLLAFLMYQSPVRLDADHGIWRWHTGTMVRGLVLATLLIGLGSLLGLFLPHPGAAAMPFRPTMDPIGMTAILVNLLLAVSLEELLYRVYLIGRLVSLGTPGPLAMAMAVCLFAIGHQYQGLTGLVLSLVLGTLLSLAWWRFRNYWVIWIGHLGYNLVVLFGFFLLS